MASFQEEDETIIIVDSEDATYIEVIEEASPSIIVDGIQGPQGVQGSTGPSGSPGPTGSIGATGATGSQGATGSGSTGATGPQGATGISGPVGATGAGVTGATGPQGVTGVTGGIGATGSIGETGPQGQTGPQGATGPKGELAGLSWTYQINTSTSGDRDPGNDNLGFVTLPYYNATQIVVDDNPYGINTTLHELFLNVQSAYLTLTSQLDPYIYATWKVTSCVDGTVTNETADGSYVIFNVDASNMGYGSFTDGELVTLSLSIIGSQGATGAAGSTGASGPQGATGSQGSTGPIGPQGSSGASGPAGATGTQGFTGATGATGAQGIQGATGPAGTDALWNFTGAYSGGAAYAVGDVATYNGETWYRINSNGGNVGDTPVEGTFWTMVSAKGLDGATGAIGETGPQGATGPAGTNGNAGATGPVGATGTAGAVGSTGPTGPVGATGSGAVGATGATGAGGALGYWGSFWSTQDQVASLADTEYAITYNNSDLSNNGVSIVDSSKVTFANAGVYSITFSVQFVNTNNQIKDANIWLKKNGTNIDDSDSKWSIIQNHGSVDGHALGTVNFVLSLSSNDYIQLYWQTTSTDVSIQYVPAASPAPAIPSIILTATQVMYTQIGPSGPTGPQGATGVQGFTGPAGSAGTVGATGVAGTAGATGVQGSTGPQGATGPAGVVIVYSQDEGPSILNTATPASLLDSVPTITGTAGDVFKIRGSLRYKNDGSGGSRTFSINMKVGSTTVVSNISFTVGVSTSYRACYFEGTIRVEANSDLNAELVFAYSGAAQGIGYGVATEAIQSGVSLDIIGTVGSTATQEMQLNHIVIEKVPA